MKTEEPVQWEHRVRQSLFQQGQTDIYELGTSFHIKEYKEIDDTILPIIIKIIKQHKRSGKHNRSRQQLQLNFGMKIANKGGI